MGFLGPLGDFADCLVKNVFCDIVKPQIGSIVKVDLVGSSYLSEDVCHTGVYIGNDEIVELTQNDNGDAEIRTVSAEEFIEGDAPLPRTGCFIYVACSKRKNGDCYALGGQKIADRAKEAAGLEWQGKYSLSDNNCHIFCQYCITGRKKGASCLLSGIESALKKNLHTGDVLWRSTGESRGSNPSFE